MRYKTYMSPVGSRGVRHRHETYAHFRMHSGCMGKWCPADDAELATGWRLWLELSDRVWPDPSWDGTPADAIRQVRALLAVCEDIRHGRLAWDEDWMRVMAARFNPPSDEAGPP